MPLIADNILVFLIRGLIRWYLRFDSHTWPKMDAKIDVSFAPKHEMYPYAEICYIYTVNGDEHYGRYKRGFWYDESARSFAEKFVPNEHFSIRVRPDRPEKSYVFEEDQSWWTGFPL